MTLGGLNGGFFDVALEEFGVFVGWRVGGDELGASVEEEFFVGGDTLLTV